MLIWNTAKDPAAEDTVQKIAVITGCSSGIGMLTAVEMARRGFRVVATMRNLAKRAPLDSAAAEDGVTLDVRRLDITEYDSLAPFIQQVVGDHGRIDVLVNNAGFAMGGFAEDVSLEELRQQMETNFYGHVAMTQAAFPVFRRQADGLILMISSISGRCPHPVVGAYAASKFALEAWSEALRIESWPLGIRVVLIEPGAFQSNIWAENVKVAARGRAEDSPNRERYYRFAQFIQKSVRKKDARIAARAVAAIAQKSNPKLRYLVGYDAHLQHWFRQLTPWNLYERLLAKAARIV